MHLARSRKVERDVGAVASMAAGGIGEAKR
jgi:hypothetical protein